MNLDIEAARSARPYSRREYVGRVLWALATPAFRFSPRPLHGWRRMLLRAFGASVGRGVHVDPTARIMLPWKLVIEDHASIGDRALIYNLGRVRIGARATISHLAHLCAGSHDHRDPALPLLRLPIEIGADAWVCAQAFVGPGLVVGEGAIVGAGAVVTRSIEPWVIAGGNPARPIGRRDMHEAAAT